MKKITFLLILVNSVLMFSQEQSVSDVLAKAQKELLNQDNLSCNLNYSYYPTYNSVKALESYDGKLVKKLKNFYIKIKSTIFLNDVIKKKSLKLNEDQKAILVSDVTSNLEQQNVIDNQQLLKQFKSYKLIDKEDHWICQFIAPQISQLPYSKVEVLIRKSDYKTLKQTLYFSAKVPYLDKQNKEIFDNPRLEVTINNYSTDLTKEEIAMTTIDSYITITKQKIVGKKLYKDYSIIEN